MDADLQNVCFCLVLSAVPLGALRLSHYLERKATAHSESESGDLISAAHGPARRLGRLIAAFAAG